MSAVPGDVSVPVGRRPRLRLFVSGLVAALGLVPALALGAPTAAHADAGHSCVPADLGTVHFTEDRWLYVVRFLQPVTDIFFPSDIKRETNGAETNKTVEYTDVTATTFTFKSGFSFSQAATQKLSAELSRTRTYGITQEITYQKMTSFTRKETVVVPPMGQAEAQYGLAGYRIVYDLTVYYKDLINGACRVQGYASYVVAEAPTTTQEWRTVYWPNINRGGVVNATTYSAADIHPGTVVAIFGQYFRPNDTVVVTQDGNTWQIGAGSAWWYDSESQINATLPGSLQPGRSANIQVRASNGLLSNVRSVFINP